ncbi:citrate lyase subunit beta/citryl-CoA lyase [Kribbella sp. VKM Ac-2527]|uniref:Citrate lyase subunit beta/citryl-CoA lyase n=1 Tax=Kribbella caucasensis TaxID=2512215 RepID=A0A4R6KKC5_9ACTN|nr:CoA ester lyase [Kribbella sp. VKM Ac-2527]TDO51613.1 citrate lyase subunit beta/citryl-CoA lyase [Kribbella sp. VKM Ac-2527]
MHDLIGRAGAARTLLFVPGDRPELFAKAERSGADLVVLDLEDAVHEKHKREARDAVAEYLGTGTVSAVRMNASGTAWHDEDIRMVASHDCIAMVPKAAADNLMAVAQRLGAGRAMIALVETSAGVLDARRIAEVAGVERLALGTFDLAAELGVTPEDREAMAVSRNMMVLASSAAGIAPPIDGITAALGEENVLRSDLAYARRLGFGGKLCIHPAQVSVAAEMMMPDAQQLAWAGRVLAAAEHESVAVVDGQMVDRPVILRARRLLAAAEQSMAGPTNE